MVHYVNISFPIKQDSAYDRIYGSNNMYSPFEFAVNIDSLKTSQLDLRHSVSFRPNSTNYEFLRVMHLTFHYKPKTELLSDEFHVLYHNSSIVTRFLDFV